MDYNITDIPGEPISETATGRWQWVQLTYVNGQRERKYYHVDCDCISDDDGRCILCKARAF